MRIQVLRARQVAGDDAYRGLVISEQDVDALFTRPLGAPHWSSAPHLPELAQLESLLAQRVGESTRRRDEALQQGTSARLWQLMGRFQLTGFDLDVLLIGLAPELDVRYERLFAYLQDDVTRKRPSVDMALGLLCPSLEERLAGRGRFAPGAPLRHQHLLHLFAEPSHAHPTLLGSAFKVDERIVDWLLGSDAPGAGLEGHVRRVPPRSGSDAEPPSEELAALVGRLDSAAAEGAAVYLQGPSGVGKRAMAEALGSALGKPLVVLEGLSLESLSETAAEDVVRLALREAVLSEAVLYWHGADASLAGDGRGPGRKFLRALEEHPGLMLLGGETHWEPTEALRARHFSRLELKLPELRERTRLWAAALARDPLEAGSPSATPPAATEPEAESLVRFASRFRFTAGQIQAAATTAWELARARGAPRGQVSLADLSEACHRHSSRALASLARRVSSPHGWDDLVLPEAQLERLREICNHARYREKVFRHWGFERKLATGKGLNLLFTGAPGTGKTMAAGIMAGELGLELYQIDLASVVSKYIGETEKQLGRLFDEAERGGAVLFFDEADALFGKRSEVRDSHDRYANLETSYLLQRIDAYEGLVILASNFSRNLDEAFVRRFQFIVEFSNPEERERRLIWERIWPEGMPRAPDLDLGLMARRFELSGGHIRNIAVAAAFLAAAREGQVSMADLFHATRREYQKLGRRVDESLFQLRS
jgi:MoxR-like ATPase